MSVDLKLHSLGHETQWDVTSSSPSPAQRVLSFFTFEKLLIAALLVVAMVMAQPLRIFPKVLQDPDIWWHLADARLFVAHGFIHTEPYSFSVAGKPWINPEWLAELPYWVGYHFGGLRGIYIVTLIAFQLNALAMFGLARMRTSDPRIAFLVAGLGIMLATVNSGPRTILFGYLCLAAELACIELYRKGRRNALWFLPPLFAIWINLHGSWSIGLFIYGIFLITLRINMKCGDIVSFKLPDEEFMLPLRVAIVSFLCLFLNPYGWRLLWNPIDMALNQPLNIAYAEEWQPLHLSWFLGKCVILAIGLVLLANTYRRRTWSLAEACTMAFGIYTAFDHVRFCFLLAILLAPTLGEDLSAFPLFDKDVSGPERTRVNAALTIGLLVFMVVVIPTPKEFAKAYQEVLPTKLEARIQPQWRLFNAFNIGGWLAFDHEPEMIDSRMDTFEHHGVLKDYVNASNGFQTLEILDKYKIDHVLEYRKARTVYLLEHTGKWHAVADDGDFVLLDRTSH